MNLNYSKNENDDKAPAVFDKNSTLVKKNRHIQSVKMTGEMKKKPDTLDIGKAIDRLTQV